MGDDGRRLSTDGQQERDESSSLPPLQARPGQGRQRRVVTTAATGVSDQSSSSRHATVLMNTIPQSPYNDTDRVPGESTRQNTTPAEAATVADQDQRLVEPKGGVKRQVRNKLHDNMDVETHTLKPRKPDDGGDGGRKRRTSFDHPDFPSKTKFVPAGVPFDRLVSECPNYLRGSHLEDAIDWDISAGDILKVVPEPVRMKLRRSTFEPWSRYQKALDQQKKKRKPGDATSDERTSTTNNGQTIRPDIGNTHVSATAPGSILRSRPMGQRGVTGTSPTEPSEQEQYHRIQDWGSRLPSTIPPNLLPEILRRADWNVEAADRAY